MQCDFELDGILLHTCDFSGYVSEETGTSCEDEDMGDRRCSNHRDMLVLELPQQLHSLISAVILWILIADTMNIVS